MIQYQGKTRQEWLDEINALTVDGVIEMLIFRLIGTPEYTFIGDPSYDNLEMQNKPSLSAFQDELSDYQSEQTIHINALFDKMELDASSNARMDAFDIVLAADMEGVLDQYRSEAAIRKHIIDNSDTALLDALEAHIPAIDALVAKESGIKAAKLAVEGGGRVVALMNARNAAKSLTTAQVKSLVQDVNIQLIQALLSSGSLVTAKEEITNYTPDGVLVTQEDKDALLAELTAMGV